MKFDRVAKFAAHKKIRPRFPEARSYTARGVHPAALPSWFISSRRLPLSNETSGERSAAVTQQLFLANGCCEPRVEFLFSKRGL
jgi:hypothetical protein